MADETFEADIGRLVSSVNPSSGDNLTGTAIDFTAYLSEAKGIAPDSVHVDQTTDPSCLISARCAVAPG